MVKLTNDRFSFFIFKGSIWKVQWAHPEFGQVLASCSYDRSVRIWEEQEGKFQSIIFFLIPYKKVITEQ